MKWVDTWWWQSGQRGEHAKVTHQAFELLPQPLTSEKVLIFIFEFPPDVYRHSSVGIATRYELDGPGIEFCCVCCIIRTNRTTQYKVQRENKKIRMGTRFFALVQTQHGIPTSSYTTGTGFLSRKWSSRSVASNTHPHPATRLKKE